jgi:hypothetical protein
MMKDMKNLINEAKDYYEVKKDLVKLKTAEKVSEGAGNAIAYVSLSIVGIFTLLFFSVTLALGLGWALDNNFWGFLIVTLIYVAAGTVIWFNKEKMFRIPVLNALIKSLFNKREDNYETGEGNKAA